MADYTNMEHEPIILRVKAQSELDKAMRALFDGPKTEEELNVAGGMKRTGTVVRRLVDSWFDNVRLEADWGDPEKKLTLHYTNINSQTVSIGGEQDTSDKAPAEIPTELQMRWPQAPPIIEPMENFDKPSWFDRMDEMVKLGRHISLASPPGIGKDTAVQQLAAIKGKPLVTIGGDAGFRRRDLVGSPQIVNGTSYFNVAEYIAAVTNGWWVLLTEVNAADADALMYINTQLAPPYIAEVEGKSYRVHPDFRLFITYNPGLVGTKPLPQSFKDRFYSIKLGFFTEAQLRRRLNAMGMNSETEVVVDGQRVPRTSLTDGSEDGYNWHEWHKILTRFGIMMWEAHERGQMRYQITTRRLYDAVLEVQELKQPLEDALNNSVIDAIDSPVEANAAKQVLSNVMSQAFA